MVYMQLPHCNNCYMYVV